MSENERIPNGSWHVCPICKGKFFTAHPSEWMYKRSAKTSGGSTKVYFCKWSCMRKWDAEHVTQGSRHYERG